MSVDKKKELATKPKPEDNAHFWIKRDDGIYSVDESVFGSWNTYTAISIAIATHKELKKQLLADSLKGDKKVKGVKVTDALISSLNKINELFPDAYKGVMGQINMYTNNMTH